MYGRSPPPISSPSVVAPALAAGIVYSYSAAVVAGMSGVGSLSPNRWVIDSGCGKHIATSLVPLTDSVISDNLKIRVASGEVLTSPSVGKLVLKTADDTQLSLSKVLTHPKISSNLMSVSALCVNGGTVLFNESKAVVMNKSGSIVFEAPREGDLYVLDTLPPSITSMSPSNCLQALWLSLQTLHLLLLFQICL